MAVRMTPTARAFTTSVDELPAMLAGCADTTLDTIEQWARAIVNGRSVRIVNHTPRGFRLSEAHAHKVLDAVRIEQSRRAGL